MTITFGDLNSHHLNHTVVINGRTGVLEQVEHFNTGVTKVHINGPLGRRSLPGVSTWPSSMPVEVQGLGTVPDEVPSDWEGQ